MGVGSAEGDEENRNSHLPEVILVTMQEKGRGEERRGAAIVGFRGSRRRLEEEEEKSGRSKVLLLGEWRVTKEDEVTSVGPRARTHTR